MPLSVHGHHICVRRPTQPMVLDTHQYSDTTFQQYGYTPAHLNGYHIRVRCLPQTMVLHLHSQPPPIMTNSSVHLRQGMRVY